MAERTTAVKHDETGSEAAAATPPSVQLTGRITDYWPRYGALKGAIAGVRLQGPAPPYTSAQLHEATRIACPVAPSGKRRAKNEEEGGANRDHKPMAHPPWTGYAAGRGRQEN